MPSSSLTRRRFRGAGVLGLSRALRLVLAIDHGGFRADMVGARPCEDYKKKFGRSIGRAD